MDSGVKPAELAEAVGELVEQRVRLEDRLAEFYRVASDLGRQPLSPGAAGTLSDLKTAIGRFDTDLTRLANAVHAVTGSAGPAVAPVCQVLFVRCGEQQFALRVADVKEIRSWPSAGGQGWRDREMKVLKLESALQIENYTAPASRKLVVLNVPTGAAVLVDEISRQDELLLQPLAPLGPGPFCGAVSGLNGELVPVIESAALFESTASVR